MNVQINQSILAVVLCWGISLSALTQAGTYSGGAGTEANPYQISAVNDWMELIGAWADWNNHFILTADLDFGGAAITPVARDTNPSSSGFQGTEFTGVLDGGGHVLRNFVINRPTSDYVGLFGQVGSGGQVRNLGVEPLQVAGREYVGGLCGLNYGTITSCYATGAVSGTSGVGGLCGENSYNGTITSCYATGAVSGDWNVGGLCGENSYGAITSCYATGAVSGDWNVGGLCGRNYYGTISSSFWDTDTSGLTTSAGGTGKTTAQMMDINTFLNAGWDFAVTDYTPAVWYMPEGDYPGLTCQLSVEVADVTGLPLSEAAAQLIQTWPGLNVVLSVEASDTIAEGHVIRQTPSPGSLLPGNSIVSVVIAGKPLGYAGSGVPEAPYQIDTPSDWLWLIQTPSDWSKRFVLTADLDFGGGTITPVAPDTDPFDYYFQGTAFTGVLDGGGHVLRNFVINQPASDYVGLFGQVGSRGQIRNLGIEPLQVAGRECVGGLCGWNYYGAITSCYATSAVTGAYEFSRVGGLCGWNYSGTITSCYATGAVNGYWEVGGLCGSNSGTINTCYATGAVTGDGLVGGLCGRNGSTITSCYATGAVSGTRFVGGLCGENSYGAITSCYATGAVTGNSSVGGLCGENDEGTISGSFWDTDASGLTTSAGGTGKTTAQMKNVNTFLNAGWDFAVTDYTPAVWYMPEGDYPGLTCQLSVEVADVTGLPLTDAAAPLIQTWPGLNVVLSVEASDTIAEGHVIRQTPSPGSLLPGNSIVSVVIAGKPSGYAGSGVPGAPYQIDTPSDWLWLIQTPSDWNKRFVLTADLDFGGGIITPVAPDTDPSNYDFQGTAFTGVYDGGGHVLRNYVINQPASDYVGLFGQVGSGGQVRNLGIEPLQVTGREYAGGLCGENYEGAIISCYATGAVTGTGYSVGGLCGQNLKGTITSCYATGAVTGTSYVGGLCGANSFSGTITSCYTTGVVSGGLRVGGLCGQNFGTITSCYATGAVCGGLRVGGLCGYGGTITSCYATGAVTGTDSVGGLCGYGGTISASFWDIDASGMTTSDGGTGKTTAQMQTLSTFASAGWDFSTVWKMLRENEDYPRLIWQEEFAGDIAGLYGVDLIDLSYLSRHWGLTDCGGADDCGRVDIDNSGDVGIGDLLNIANDWLKR